MLYTLRNKCNLIKRFLNQACLFLFVVILFTIELTGCDSRPSYPKTNQNIFLNLKNFIRVLDKKESDTMFKFSFFSWSGNYLPDSNKFVPEIEYFGFLKLVENNALNYSCDSAINDVKFIDFNMNVHDTIYINSFFWVKKYMSDPMKVYKSYKLIREDNVKSNLTNKNIFHYKFKDFSFKMNQDDLDIFITNNFEVVAACLIIPYNNKECIYMFTGDSSLIKDSNQFCKGTIL